MNDSGSAFPVPNSANVNGQEGMTLRDHFAGLALQGMLAGIYSDPRQIDELDSTSIAEFRIHFRANADLAYEAADAMLAARDGKEVA